MKSLKPTMKENKRYLFVRGNNLEKNIEKAILGFIGILGAAKVGLNFIKKDKESAVISVNRECVDKVRASLCVWQDKIEVLRVSGTLKGLRQ